MFDDFRGALEAGDFAYPRDGRGAALELDSEFEVLVGVETLCVDAELGHKSSLDLDLSGHLLYADDDELGGLERRESDVDVDDPEVDVILGRRVLVALHEVGLFRGAALEGALPEEVL